MTAAIARLKEIDIDRTDNLFSGAFKLLIAGVGFLEGQNQKNQCYKVFSHYGDYLGSIPQYMVATMIAHLRRQFNLDYEKCPGHYGHSLTYGWKNLVPFEKVEEIMNQYSDKPLEIV